MGGGGAKIRNLTERFWGGRAGVGNYNTDMAHTRNIFRLYSFFHWNKLLSANLVLGLAWSLQTRNGTFPVPRALVHNSNVIYDICHAALRHNSRVLRHLPVFERSRSGGVADHAGSVTCNFFRWSLPHAGEILKMLVLIPVGATSRATNELRKIRRWYEEPTEKKLVFRIFEGLRIS